MNPMIRLEIAFRSLFRGAALLLLASGAPLLAEDGADVWAEVSARAVQSDRAVFEGEDIESSGFGLGADAGFEWRGGRTTVQFDLGASVFDYEEPTRATRESASAGLTVGHEITETVSVALNVGHWDDIVTLESREVDQDAIRLEVKYEDKEDRVRLRAQYREREYETAAGQTGQGMRYDLQYNRRLGSWHWARFELQYDDIDSDSLRRGYNRASATASYSLPIARNLRLRPEIEVRRWRYDDRRVLDDPTLVRRRDSYVAPEIGLAYGRSEGLNARLRAAYQLRSSNDPRFGDDAPYLSLSLGYRF